MVKIRHRAKYRSDRSNRCVDMVIFRFFKNGGSPPSWICDARVWTTHERNLVVFITVQNLVGIDNVQVLVYCDLGLKTPIQVPKIGVLPEKVDQSSPKSLKTCYAAVPLTMPNFIVLGHRCTR